MSNQVKPNVRTLADRIKSITGVDDKGQGTDNAAFRTIASEDGIDVDRYIKEQEYTSTYISAQNLAFGEHATEHLKNNPDSTIVSAIFEIGRSRLELSFDRHVREPNRVPKEGGGFDIDGEREIYGRMKSKFKVRGAAGSKGELKAIHDFISTEARTAFAS